MYYYIFQSKQFPISTNTLVSILEVIAPFKHFAKVRELMLMNKLPPGFPVKIGQITTLSFLPTQLKQSSNSFPVKLSK